MHARILAAAALAAGLGLTTIAPAGAAAAPQVTDATGDGNFANGQGFVTGTPAAATPASLASLDITAIQWSTKFVGSGKKKTATDIVVTMTTAGAIADQGKSAIWRATAMLNGSCSFYLAYATYADGAPSSSLRICDDSTLGYHDLSIKGAAKGNTITWTVPIKSLKGEGVKVGSVLDTLGGHTRMSLGTSATGGATVPQADEAESSTAYKVGS